MMERASPDTAFATGHSRVETWPGLHEQNYLDINFCKNSTVLNEAKSKFHGCKVYKLPQ